MACSTKHRTWLAVWLAPSQELAERVVTWLEDSSARSLVSSAVVAVEAVVWEVFSAVEAEEAVVWEVSSAVEAVVKDQLVAKEREAPLEEEVEAEVRAEVEAEAVALESHWAKCYQSFRY